jgi:hypothetical protein
MNNVIFGRQFCIWELLAWETLYFDFVIKPITVTIFMWWGSSSYLYTFHVFNRLLAYCICDFVIC